MSETGAAARRVIEAFVPRRSPLRRGSDRIEVAARWVLLVVGLLLVPVALTAGSEVTARLAPQLAVQQAERHQVAATVWSEPRMVRVTRGDGGGPVWLTPVRWTAADGTPREAVVQVASQTRVGDTREVWVDRADRLVPPPMASGSPEFRGVLTTLFIVVADLVASLLLLAGLRWLLDRRRLHEWEKAWRRFTGPDQQESHR